MLCFRGGWNLLWNQLPYPLWRCSGVPEAPSSPGTLGSSKVNCSNFFDLCLEKERKKKSQTEKITFEKQTWKFSRGIKESPVTNVFASGVWFHCISVSFLRARGDKFSLFITALCKRKRNVVNTDNTIYLHIIPFIWNRGKPSFFVL